MASVVIRAALPSLRIGLARMLTEQGHTVVEEHAADEAAVLVLDAPSPPDLAALSAGDAREAPRAVVVLTDEPATATRLARAPARGWACLSRDIGPTELDLAVRAAEAGLALLDLSTAASAVVGSPSVEPGRTAGGDPLSPREVQVLHLIAQGLPNKGIAHALGITENTVKFHVASLSGKLGAGSRTEAVTLAARRGLLVL